MNINVQNCKNDGALIHIKKKKNSADYKHLVLFYIHNAEYIYKNGIREENQHELYIYIDMNTSPDSGIRYMEKRQVHNERYQCRQSSFI